jgi:hypothetical protein
MYKLVKVSRWITLCNLDITEKHSLYYYADKDSENNGKYTVSAFRYNNKWYAIDQFLARFGWMGFDIECKNYPPFIIAYDGEGNIYNPLLLEMDDNCEKIRLWMVA